MDELIGITRQAKLDKTSFSIPANISEYDKEVLNHAISSFSFILKSGHYTFAEFADYINEYTTMATPETKEIIRVLKSL
ncbi:hypothetical protein F7U66_01300 [Vibrio parahaemolyticus]|nr:hypothetical protein [Vibrio parahaemolyticus]